MDTQPSTPSRPHVYFRPTTLGQRQVLFDLAQQMGNVSKAACEAHVSRGTYYYWQARYQADGSAGLVERSRAPHHPRVPALSAELRAEVLAYRQAHPRAGYRTIASRINQAHDWHKVIGPTKVRDLVLAARAAEAATSPAPVVAPPAPPVKVVHAPRLNQTMNIDLLVVPCAHDGQSDLLSVSVGEASAGVPIPEPAAPPARAEWPGQTFANPALSYEDQVLDYVKKRTAKRLAKGQRKHQRHQKQAERAEWSAQNDELRLQRHRVRIARQTEDVAWQAKRREQRQADQTWQHVPKRDRRERRAER